MSSGLSYCQIMVGRVMTGIVGLGELMAALADEGIDPATPGLGKRLVDGVAEHNYVPRTALLDYTAALLREYERYLQSRDSGSESQLWRDPRKEHKPWYPAIFTAKCNACGECIDVCPNGVLGWNPDHTEVLVWEPYECSPGCRLCERACRQKAIVLPPREVLHQRVERPTTPESTCATCQSKDCANCG